MWWLGDDTTDPAPAPVASKEPEKGKNYFGLYLLVGGRKPYTIWNPIYCRREATGSIVRIAKVSSHGRRTRLAKLTGMRPGSVGDRGDGNETEPCRRDAEG